MKKAKFPTDVVLAACPTNAASEREKFFSEGEQAYEPQFAYKLPPPLLEQALRRYSEVAQVESKYVPHALKVLETLLQRCGSYEAYELEHGGEVLSEADAGPIVDDYLERLGVDRSLAVHFDPDLVARASFVKRAARLKIRPQGLRRNWIIGTLHHEVGTHFLRDLNDRSQPWARERNGRKRYRMEDKNPTEEGLASLHTVLEREGHCLWRPALLYYATWKALQLSFRDLFDDLARFLGDNVDERWDYCVRAKRGLLDTSLPGGFAKDQMYLKGALEILEQRHRVDFNALYAGKISVADAHRAKATGLSKLQGIRLPFFLQGKSQQARYLQLLDETVKDNGLSELIDGNSAKPAGGSNIIGTRPGLSLPAGRQKSSFSRSLSAASSSRQSALAVPLPPSTSPHVGLPPVRH